MNRCSSSTLLLCVCLLGVLACGGESDTPTQPATGPTWYRDVLPVAQESCLGCHNDEAPTFSMESYSDDLRARANAMAAYTEAGIMPPWKPSADCNHYQNERRIDAAAIQLFADWAAAGAPAGDPADAPPPIDTDTGLPRVDRTIAMADDYTPKVEPSDPDDLHCFVLDPELTTDARMLGFDVHPGEPRVVHHVLLYLADASEADALDAADPGLGYSCFGGPLATSAAVVAGWVPGMPAITYPEGTGIPLAEGSKLIMQIHYNTLQAGPLPDRTAVDLMLTDATEGTQAQIMSVRDTGFAIPPNTKDHSTTVTIDAPGDGTIWASAPHMHYLGRRARVWVEHQDGGESCIIDIPDWDFDWQQFYFFADAGVKVDEGDRVHFSCTWDNHTDQTVTWGDGTTDEMCIAYFYVTAGH